MDSANGDMSGFWRLTRASQGSFATGRVLSTIPGLSRITLTWIGICATIQTLDTNSSG